MEDRLNAYLDKIIAITGLKEKSPAGYQAGESGKDSEGIQEGEILISAHNADSGECPMPHGRSCYELIYVHSGDICIRFGGEGKCHLVGGSFALIGGGPDRDIKINDPTSRVACIFMDQSLFQGSFLFMILDSPDISGLFLPTRSDEDFLIRVWHCDADGLPDSMKGYLANLFREYLKPDSRSLSVMSLNLAGIFFELSRLGCDAEKHAHPKAAFSFSDVLAYLNNHLADATLLETAAHFDYSPRHFSLLIRDACGLSFCGLLKELRLTKVALLLEKTTAPVREVLARCGYQNTTYFYRIFEEKYKMTPIEYRRKKTTG